jgi:hypothetical protein
MSFQNYSVEIQAVQAAEGTPEGAVEHWAPLKTFRHQGRTLIIGAPKNKYRVVVRNNTWYRIEAVISVDGMDVVDGSQASLNNRGYIIAPHGTLEVTGFRVSDEKVAQFEFGAVEEAYATKKGDKTNIGVIGVAIFTEKPALPTVYVTPVNPFAKPLMRWTNINYTKSTGQPASISYTSSTDVGEAVYGCLLSASTSSTTALDNLGTVFGSEISSPVSHTQFERESRAPDEIFRFYYNSRPAFEAMGIPVPVMTDQQVKDRLSADPFPATPSRKYCEPPTGWKQ